MIQLEDWKEIEGELPWGNYLVTNNLIARGNSGHMSHVWHVNMVHHSKEKKYGTYTAFHGDNDIRVYGLTHYIDLSPITG